MGKGFKSLVIDFFIPLQFEYETENFMDPNYFQFSNASRTKSN